MAGFLLGALTAACGAYLIVRRKEVAARTVRQQNRLWRTNYGSRAIRHNERALLVVGISAIAFAVVLWAW